MELIGDGDTLQPDVFQLVEAAKILISDGFKVLPYCTEDLITCRRLLDAGCEALMPWAAPIGTGLGAVHAYALRVLRERLPNTPLIVYAGLGLPSQAAQVMEWGHDGVLLNTAVSCAGDPVNGAGEYADGGAAVLAFCTKRPSENRFPCFQTAFCLPASMPFRRPFVCGCR